MQIIDPEVSRRKFAESLAQFRTTESAQRHRGILLLHAEFPDMVILFSAPKLKPLPVVFGVRINFDNYDLEPLSVRFVDPLTWEPLQQAPVQLLRKVPPYSPFSNQPLLINEITGLPFVCLPGIREYHRHPAHTGDPWLLHRDAAGEGSLGFILDKLYEYGIISLSGFQIQFNFQSPAIQIASDLNLIPQ